MCQQRARSPGCKARARLSPAPGHWLVVALGADYDLAATPGLREGGHEFYSVAGACALRDVLPTFERGPAIIGVTGKSFKCPPAPSETALLLHDYLVARGRRDATEISLVMPFGTPIPPSPDTSKAILAAFEQRGIRFVKDTLVKALDPVRKVALLSDGGEMPYALFLGVPVHRVPEVVVASGLASHPYDWVPVNKQTLETRVPGVYAVGDVIGYPSLASAAYGQGRFAASHLLGAPCDRMMIQDIPTGIYTSPEISSVGKTERELTEAKVPYEVGQALFRSLARAQITGQTTGMLKLLFHRETLEVLGVHCFGANASEIIHIGQAIFSQPPPQNTLMYFINITFNYPTMAEAYRVAALNGYNRLF